MSETNDKGKTEDTQDEPNSFLDDLKNQLDNQEGPGKEQQEKHQESLEEELSAMLSTEFDAPERLDEEHNYLPQDFEDTAAVELADEALVDEILEDVLKQLKTQTVDEPGEHPIPAGEEESRRKQEIQEELATLIKANSQRDNQSEEDRKKLDDLLLQLERQTVKDEWVPETVGDDPKGETVGEDEISEDVSSKAAEPVIEDARADENALDASSEDERQADTTDTPTLEPEDAQENIEEAIKTSILNKDVAGTEIELERLIERDKIFAVLIFKMSKTWASAGKLSIKDINDIEGILAQSKKTGKKIDMARFLKLGIQQQKYLLYAASVSNVYTFCSINATSNPLSQIRRQTLDIAEKLTLPDDPEADLILEEEEEALAQVPDDVDEPVISAAEEEATHTTLDELLAEDAMVEDSPPEDDEFEEWVHEVIEEESAVELTESPAEDTYEDEMEPAPELQTVVEEQPEEQLEEQPEGQTQIAPVDDAGDAAYSTVSPDEESTEEAYADEITPVEPAVEPEEPLLAAEDSTHEEALIIEETRPPEHTDELMEEEPVKRTIDFPKAGYGRYRNVKNIKGKIQLRSKEQQEFNQKLNLIYKIKPADAGVSQAERLLDEPGQLESQEGLPAWEPSLDDPLREIRSKLKNQKQPPKKLVRFPTIEVPAETWKIQDAPSEDGSEYWDAGQVEAESPIPEDEFEAQAVDAEDSADGGTVIVRSEATQQTTTAEDEPTAPIIPLETGDQILPPETLQDLEQADPESTGADFQEDIDNLLHDIMQDLQEEDEEPGGAVTAEIEPGFSMEGKDTALTVEKELDEDDVVIFDENLDFLKTLADLRPGVSVSDDDKDATEFFEEYIQEAGEPIEDQETAPPEPAPSQPEEKAEDTAAPAGLDEGTDDFTAELDQPDSDVDAAELLNLLREELDETQDETLPGGLPPDLEDEFSQTMISLQDEDQKEKEEGFEAVLFGGRDLQEEEEPAIELPEPAAPEVDVKEDEADDTLRSMDQIEDVRLPPDIEDNIDEFPEFDEEDLLETAGVEETQEEVDLNQIVSEVLAEQHEDEDEEKAPKVVETWDEVPASVSDQEPEEAEQPEQTEMSPTAMDDLFGEDLDPAALGMEDLLPWEMDSEKDEDDIEITPTPRSLMDEDQSADVLVDLLAKTSLEPVQLGFDQPIYTCILVPELSEFSLNNKIASRIKEWLPKLSRVYGWEFENVFIQPTYLQWTVRVPSGTSQGSIVRRIRQQTSLRIFDEFPELKELSLGGNFWAKGYLVVSGSNPPPAEFLDDFIQKNRRPSGIMGT